VDNVAGDLVAVSERLDALGYASERAHSLRVLSYAIEGVHAFEDACDVGVSPCRVDNVTCGGTRATARSTCLRRDVPCALGRVAPNSTVHRWLRAKNAPSWRAMPTDGRGFTTRRHVHGRPNAQLWANEWAVEALVRAGRHYDAARFDGVDRPRERIDIVHASSREGGG
jgi:hypothetical protein